MDLAFTDFQADTCQSRDFAERHVNVLKFKKNITFFYIR
jgi:hypothetical protein